MISKQQEKKLLRKLNKIEIGIKDLELSEKKRSARIIKRNKKVRFPGTIDILGNTWKVELDDYLTDSDDGKVNGLCLQNRKIKLCLSNEDIIKTLLHEIQHAIDQEYGKVFDELRNLKGNKYFNEFRVDTLAKIWLNVFKVLKNGAN